MDRILMAAVFVLAGACAQACPGKRTLIETVVAYEPLELGPGQRERLSALFERARAGMVADHLRGSKHEHGDVLARFAVAADGVLTPQQRAAQARRAASRLAALKQGAQELGDMLAALRGAAPDPGSDAPRPVSPEREAELERRLDALLAELKAALKRIEDGQQALVGVDLGPEPSPWPSARDLRDVRLRRAQRRSSQALGALWAATYEKDHERVRSLYLGARRLGKELRKDGVLEVRQEAERTLRSARWAALTSGAMAGRFEGFGAWRASGEPSRLLLRSGHEFDLAPGFERGPAAELQAFAHDDHLLVFFAQGKVSDPAVLVLPDLGRAEVGR